MYLCKSDVILEYVDGLVQSCINSSALAKPSMCNSANKYRVKCRTRELRNNLQKYKYPNKLVHGWHLSHGLFTAQIDEIVLVMNKHSIIQ